MDIEDYFLPTLRVTKEKIYFLELCFNTMNKSKLTDNPKLPDIIKDMNMEERRKFMYGDLGKSDVLYHNS